MTLASGTYTVAGSHTYNDEGIFAVTVTVNDEQSSVSFSTTATMHEELLFDNTTGTPNQKFVNEVYRDLLGRKTDGSGLAYWVGQLNQGVSRAQVASDIENSDEYRTIQVESLYGQFLHRAADPGGLAFGMGYLKDGGTVDGLAAILATMVARMNPKTAIKEGDVARVLVDTEALHFFDAVTGEGIRSQRGPVQALAPRR